MRRALNESVCQSVRSSSAPLQLQGEAEQAMQRRRDKRMGGGGLGARPFVAAMMSAAAFAVVVVFSSLLSSSPPFRSLPFPSSLPFSNPLPKPVVFQLFSQNQSNGTSCSTDPGMSPPGPSSRAPGFSIQWVAGFVTGRNLHPVDGRFFPPVILLT